MKITIWSCVFPPASGGMERFAEQLAGWLHTKGHEVSVITATPEGRPCPPRVDYEVIREIGSTRAQRRLRTSDVVHVNGLSLRGIRGASSAGARGRTVVTHHGHQAVCPVGLAWAPTTICDAGPGLGPCRGCDRRGLRGVADVRLHRAAARFAAAQTFVSRYLRSRLGLTGEVLYNPVQRSLFEEPDSGPGDEGLLVAAGRMVSEKGFDLLLHSLARVPGARLEIVGDGPMRAELFTLVERLRISGRVRFLGQASLPGVVEVYRRASLVVVPSLSGEAFGYAAAEAMALGRPVVGTPNGALVELLAEGRGLVAMSSSPEALSEAIQEGLNSRDRRVAMGLAARRFGAQAFHIDTIGPKYERIYRSCAR